MNTLLEDISNWLKANKFTPNVKKSNLLLFNLSRNKKLKETIKISIENQKYAQKEYAKYISVYIDCHLSWEKHIEIKNFKISKGTGILRKMGEFLQEKQLKNLYYAFIRPCTEYGILAWGGAPKAHVNKVSRSTKKAARVVMFKNIVSFDINIKLQQGKFMKQLSLDLQPESITKHFPLRFIDSISNTNSDKLIIPYHRTTVGVSSLFYQGYKRWNEIPKKFRQTQFIKKFYKDYQQYLIEQV